MEIVEIETIRLLAGIMCIILLIGGVTLYANDKLSSYHFCKEQGYDYPKFGADYSEHFGKIKCISFYDGQEVTEEFGVRETIFNNLVEIAE